MATLKQRLTYKNTSGTYDTIHLETEKSCIVDFPETMPPSEHTHSGADITSGTVAAARLGTMTAATASAAGASGAVPAPAAGAQAKFLRGDGTWQVPTNTVACAYCGTAAATAAKAASCSGYVLLNKSWLIVTIAAANTAASAITLNVNGTGAKPIYINGAASSTSNYTLPAGTYLVYYDGTRYQFRTDGVIPVPVDTIPTASSLRAVTSGGLYTALYKNLAIDDWSYVTDTKIDAYGNVWKKFSDSTLWNLVEVRNTDTIYYIDQTNGNDNNDGCTASTAWKNPIIVQNQFSGNGKAIHRSCTGVSDITEKFVSDYDLRNSTETTGIYFASAQRLPGIKLDASGHTITSNDGSNLFNLYAYNMNVTIIADSLVGAFTGSGPKYLIRGNDLGMLKVDVKHMTKLSTCPSQVYGIVAAGNTRCRITTSPKFSNLRLCVKASDGAYVGCDSEDTTSAFTVTGEGDIYYVYAASGGGRIYLPELSGTATVNTRYIVGQAARIFTGTNEYRAGRYQ